MFALNDRVAVVTGAGSGIGAAIAAALAGAGARVHLLDRDANAGAAVAASLPAGRGVFTLCDISDAASVSAAMEAVTRESNGKVDVLVNNAGIGHVGTILTTSADDLDRLYAVNVRGLLLMTQAFLPGMLERRYGSVINIASIGGVVGIRDRLAYCATKSAVVGMTKCMALDHASRGVRFNAICPGRVRTPFVEARLREYPDAAAAEAEMTSTQPLGRMGRPEEIAAAAVYLAADESSFVTGSCFMIDGGWSAGK
ncbi:MAG TPA: SDR family oxidoreductase [Tepidisphaeraceae bacterium]|jgi:NAD(P)-dependent dehydrogenase (short-subunit alcohol dehydrogenase family)